jgi:hypothetical protein
MPDDDTTQADKQPADEQPAEQSEDQSTDSDQPVEQPEDQPADGDQPAEQAEKQPSDSDQPAEPSEEQPAESDQSAATASADNTVALASGPASPGGGGYAGRSFIIEPADKNTWANARAFNPSAGGGDKSGTTKLTVRTRPIPEGGSVRWSVPPDQAGRYRLKGGANVQSGLTADVTGIQPGLTALDFDVFDAEGKSVESQKYPLCIPQFVTVDVDAAFTALLTGYGLIDFEIRQALGVAQDVCNTLLQRANVRTIWLPFGEALPAQFGAGQPGANMVTRATFRDSGGAALYGQTHVPFGPNVFNENIDVFAGAFDDPVAGNANENLDEVTNQVVAILATSGLTSSVEKDLGIQVLGRLYGETLAHEIGHSLIGQTLTSIPNHDHNAHPGVLGDLMNLGIDRSFENRSGCSLNGGVVSTPIADSVSLMPGIAAIDVPTGTAQAQIDANFPVPPIFR